MIFHHIHFSNLYLKFLLSFQWVSYLNFKVIPFILIILNLISIPYHSRLYQILGYLEIEYQNHFLTKIFHEIIKQLHCHN